MGLKPHIRACGVDRVEIVMPAGGGDSCKQGVQGRLIRETPEGEEGMGSGMDLPCIARAHGQDFDSHRGQSLHSSADQSEEGRALVRIKGQPGRFGRVEFSQIQRHQSGSSTLEFERRSARRPASVRSQIL
ncbi:hypothetical protein D3C87_1696520 [compost metagenome]